MSNSIDISAYMSSIRPYRWMTLHKRLQETNLNFEIVIVGPSEPDFLLPPEIRFYKSDVKPSQCFHAAASLCNGKTMLQMVDDLEYSQNSIELMYNEVSQKDNVMATAHYFLDNNDHTLTQNISGITQNAVFLPLLPVCGLFHRQAWTDNHGLDRRFDGVMSELDFYMRLRNNGYQTVFVNGIVMENTSHQNKEKSSLCLKYWVKDRTSFIKLWSTNNILYPLRNDIVRPYDDKDILTNNQYYE